MSLLGITNRCKLCLGEILVLRLQSLTYDTGDYEATLSRALELADVKGFAARKQESEKNGKLRGLGYSCYIEACGLAPSNIAGALGARAGLFEVGQIRVHPTGSVTVFTGPHSHGQGHETTFAQVVADRLGIPLRREGASIGTRRALRWCDSAGARA